MSQKDEDEFRSALRRAIEEQGFSLRSFAAHLADTTGLDVSHATIQNWTTTDLPAKPAQTFALELALGMRPGALSRLLGYLPLDAAPALRPEEAIAADATLGADTRDDLLLLIRRARKRDRERGRG